MLTPIWNFPYITKPTHPNPQFEKYWKNKFLLNEYFGNFRQFLDNVFFIFMENDFFKTQPTPLKYGKFHIFLFLKASLK